MPLMLGKLPPRLDERRFRLHEFLPRATPPPSADWYKGVTRWGMMLNDQLGDCVPAAIGHAVQVATLDTPTGNEVTPPDNIIENLYEKSCGYVPGDPSTDNGGVITDVLDFVRKNGIGIHKNLPLKHHRPTLYAYADPFPNDTNHIKESIATLGMVDIGLQLPNTAQNQVGGLWDVVGNPHTDPDSMPGSWGGHSTLCGKYDPQTLTCITWGALQPMTWRFWNTYVDESHALLMHAWMQRFAPTSGVDLLLMEGRLAELAG